MHEQLKLFKSYSERSKNDIWNGFIILICMDIFVFGMNIFDQEITISRIIFRVMSLVLLQDE